MKIVRQSPSGTVVRKLLCGLLLDPVMATRVAQHWDGRLFDSQMANLVGDWAIKHVQKYGEPLGQGLESTYAKWAAKRDPEDPLAESVREFLVYLSREHDQEGPLSTAYLLDLAGEYFDTVRMRERLEAAQELLEEGQREPAREQLRQLLDPIQLGAGSRVDLANDFPAIVDALGQEERDQVLVPYRNSMAVLGKTLNQAMVREGFIGVMGSDKSGKSFFLVDLAVRAMQNRRRVAYFECGDLGEREVIQRICQRVTWKPLTDRTVSWPTGWKRGEGNEPTPIFEQRRKKGLTPHGANRALRKLTKGKSLLQLSCHPNSSINVDGIDSLLEQWSREDWVPDVVVIDYADILAPPQGVRDPLEQTDTTWKQLRRLSQRWHALVVVATQANAAAYKSDRPLSRANFSGRKTKLAHVTGMLGISRLKAKHDYDEQVSRVGWVIGRGWQWKEGESTPVVGCYECGFPFFRAFDPKKCGEIAFSKG